MNFFGKRDPMRMVFNVSEEYERDIASLFSALLLRNLEGMIWFFSWRFSLFPIFVILPVMLLLAGLFPVLFYRFAVNGSVVERLRSAER